MQLCSPNLLNRPLQETFNSFLLVIEKCLVFIFIFYATGDVHCLSQEALSFTEESGVCIEDDWGLLTPAGQRPMNLRAF